MSVCMSFQVLTQLGSCTKFSRKEKKRIRGAVTKHVFYLLFGGLERIKIQITDDVGRWLSTGC